MIKRKYSKYIFKLFIIVGVAFCLSCSESNFEAYALSIQYDGSYEKLSKLEVELVNFAEKNNYLIDIASDDQIKWLTNNENGLDIIFLNSKNKFAFSVSTLGASESTTMVDYLLSGFKSKEEMNQTIIIIDNIFKNNGFEKKLELTGEESNKILDSQMEEVKNTD